MLPIHAGRPAAAVARPDATRPARRRPLLPLAPVVALLFAACAPGLTPMARPTPMEPRAPRAASAATLSADAEYLAERQLMVPVAGVMPTRLQDSFHAARDGGRTHRAIDIMAPRGTPVIAADAGRVHRIDTNRLGGLTIYVLDPAERFMYYYAHLDGYREGLRQGMTVAQGELLGYVGSTGNASATAPHLHLQVMRYRRDRYWDGEPVNPKPFLVVPGLPVHTVTTGDGGADGRAGATTAPREEPHDDERR